jgi:hypothetical protein
MDLFRSHGVGVAIPGDAVVPVRWPGARWQTVLTGQAGPEGMENTAGHTTEFGGRAHPVATLFQIDLGHDIESAAAQDIDEVGGFDPVAGREREGAVQAASHGIFAAQGLDDAGQFREMQAEDRANEDLRHAPAAGVGVSAIRREWSFVEGFRE